MAKTKRVFDLACLTLILPLVLDIILHNLISDSNALKRKFRVKLRNKFIQRDSLIYVMLFLSSAIFCSTIFFPPLSTAPKRPSLTFCSVGMLKDPIQPPLFRTNLPGPGVQRPGGGGVQWTRGKIARVLGLREGGQWKPHNGVRKSCQRAVMRILRRSLGNAVPPTMGQSQNCFIIIWACKLNE